MNSDSNRPAPIVLRRLWRRDPDRAQGMVEFALILPMLLVLIFGTIEAGRMLAIFSTVSNSARQAARYGSVGGDSSSTVPNYLDCQGIVNSARGSSPLMTLNSISVTYQQPVTSTASFSSIGQCKYITSTLPSQMTSTTSLTRTDFSNGYRILVTVTAIYQPLTPLTPIPKIPFTFVAARTIFPSIQGPTSTPKPLPDLALDIIAVAPTITTPTTISPTTTFTVTANQNITFTVVITNLSDSTAATTGPVYFSQTIPTDWSWVSGQTSASFGSGWLCPLSPPAPLPAYVACRHSTSLAPGAVTTATFKLLAPSLLQTTRYTTTAQLTAAAGNSNSANDNETAIIDVVPATGGGLGIDLTVSKADGPDPVVQGGTVYYTLTVNNIGTTSGIPNDNSTVRITDTIPAGFASILYDNTYWGCTTPTVGNTGNVVCTRDTTSSREVLAVGPSTYANAPSIFIRVTAPSSNVTLTNTASVGLSGASTDSNTSNNTTQVTTTVSSYPDVNIIKSVSTVQVGPNRNVTYTLAVDNVGGTIAATNVQVLDNLPSDLTTQGVIFGGGCGTSWTCTYSTGTVTAILAASLAAGATAPDITIGLKSPASVLANVTVANQATVSTSAPESNTSNNTSNAVGVTLRTCNAGVLSASNSTITPTQSLTRQADNSDTATVTITLRDECNEALGGQAVTLTSSRPTFDTVTAVSGSTTNSSGIVQFTVKSGKVGNSTYTASPANLTTGSVSYGCVSYLASSISGNFSLLFSFDNQTGIQRRLRSLTLAWPDSGSRGVRSFGFTGTTNPAWSDNNNNTSPTTITSTGWNGAGSRLIANGAQQVLTINFSFDTNGAGTYTYTLTNVTWDNGTDDSIYCTTSATISITR